MTCSLPVVLAILIWWKRERIRPADFRPLLPYFLVGLPMGLLTAWLEVHHVGATGAAFNLEFYQRCIVAGRAIVFYFFKLVWPNDLTFIYPRWQVTSPWLLLVPAFVALCLLALWFLRKRIGKGSLGGRCVLYRYPGTNPRLLQRLCLPILFRRRSLAVSVEPGRDRFGECNSQHSFRCEPPCPKRGIGLRPRGAVPADRTAILHL